MKLKAHAKINLLLHVLRKREDGFHELTTLYQPLALHDVVHVSSSSGGLKITSDHSELPLDERNTAHKAVVAMAEHVGLHPQARGVHVHIQKNIPLAGGVGGSAADAAPVLEALNEQWKLGLSRGKLLQLAARVGSDVPQALLRKPAVGTGRGEKVAVAPRMPKAWVVLLDVVGDRYFGGKKDKTAELYKELSPRLAGLRRRSSLHDLKQAMATHSWIRVLPLLENDFEHVAFERHPELLEAKHFLLHNGALGALLAGAGPVVFGVVGPEREARRLAKEAERHFRSARTWVTHTL